MLTREEIAQINFLLEDMDNCIDQAKSGLAAVRNVVSYAIENTPGADPENCKAIEFVCEHTSEYLDKKLSALVDQVWTILKQAEEAHDAGAAAN